MYDHISEEDYQGLDEHTHQVLFMRWCELHLTTEQNELIWATPNGDKRSKRVGAKLRLEGVKPGVPDIFFAWPNDKYHGLFIEMKRAKRGSVSEHQARKIELLGARGYQVEVCRGCREAISVMTKYNG